MHSNLLRTGIGSGGLFFENSGRAPNRFVQILEFVERRQLNPGLA